MAKESPLELLIRPNQTGSIRPNYWNGFQSATPADATKNDNVVISFGGSGDSIFTVDNPLGGFKAEDEKNETDRTYDVARIKNPDDPDQYVDTEVMTEWKGKNKIDGSRTTLRFAAPSSDANVEILSRGNKRSSSV